MSKGIVYSLDIITASMRLRLRGRGGGTWMNDFDGGMMDTLWIEMGWLVDWGFRFLSL